VCDTTGGQCVAGTCTPSASNPPAACPVNPSDICCTNVCQPGNGAKSCCTTAADPTGSTYCTGALGSAATCVDNVCTACKPVTNGQYAVDPVHGSDSTGTGDATTAGCAFATITRALQVIGNNSALAATVTVFGPATVSAGETFPILVPTNVTITSAGGAVAVNVPATKAGFVLATASSAIKGGTAALSLSGQGNTATYGIVVDTGSQATTRLENVAISSFLEDGILVENSGILTIGSGVTSTLSGKASATARRAGLHVTGSGHAIVAVPSGQPATHFDANTNHGILVDGGGQVTLSGVVADAITGTGTVTANANYAAGVWIEQAMGAPQNLLTGLVAFGNTNGNGLRIIAGSNVKMRGSAALGNAGNGVIISSAGGKSISGIDLGTPTDFGNNTLQGTQGAANNGGAGICLTLPSGAGTLAAAGNIFGAANCASSTGMVPANHAGCGTTASCNGPCALGITGGNNDINVAMCAHN
jgi:hypothetical protein